ncbi:DeoR/GlpR family DNA-binding transcription regulator [Gordonia neofelifaecis]|uniref:Lactose phosphotransferase system repressor n=1 Tax=Gordonia neofelifaecis NRRL B-59395 TaxID=644548 RepID=F1YMT7_9ACTN|nr:DeoR/GlpR family DNA-binding transcription regulator [Gordonia neofelifaecis]EGD54022.1 regulatory protein DeoR [Gordonia neofelifaecis NRRL B-59395]
MYAEERQSAIATEVRSRGRVSVADLAARFSVTGETVRRDLAILQRSGHLVRVHGGAVRHDVAAVVDEPDLVVREETHRAEKIAIGAAAVAFLPADGGSVLIDAGTTTLQLALAIHADTRLSYVTNSVQIAGVVADLPGAGVLLTGGRLRPKTGAAVGSEAVDMLGRVRASVGFLGTNGLSVAHGLSTPDPDEAATKRAMLAACATTIVLADSSKINREELMSFGGLDDFDVLITDGGIDRGFADELRAREIEVVIA